MTFRPIAGLWHHATLAPCARSKDCVLLHQRPPPVRGGLSFIQLSPSHL